MGVVIRIGVIGIGLVGKALLSQLGHSKFKDKLQLVAVATSTKMLLDNNKPALEFLAINSNEKFAALDLDAFATFVSGSNPSNSIIVDCTASENVSKMYPQWLKEGINVVTPNKKGFSSDYSLFEKIFSDDSKGVCYHESTVGAGLPIISTLVDLLETGDEIIQIEGILSGTLSFLFNSFSPSDTEAKPQKFSQVVKQAKESGYTEPDPRDDLNGFDMARKIVILGRICGLRLSLDTLPITNIVPEELRTVETVEEFMARLSEFDDYFAQLNSNAAKKGEVLRYVGVINRDGASVQLKSYPKNHPFASLKGSDNIVLFTTARYPNSLVIQGSGAGDQVTAQGVFADILKIVRAANK